jgi:cytochrome c oxidase subunit III
MTTQGIRATPGDVPEILEAPDTRLDINRLGLWLFFASESMIFLILLVTRFYLLGAQRPEELNQGLGFLLTVVLLLSSLTAYRAETAMRLGNRKAFLLNIGLTALMGIVFLLGVVLVEWAEAPRLGIVPQSGFGIAFFSMTGMHAFHVTTGVFLLIVIFLNGRRGAYSAESHWGVEACVKYWHFVDLVWVFFYPALYLL